MTLKRDQSRFQGDQASGPELLSGPGATRDSRAWLVRHHRWLLALILALAAGLRLVTLLQLRASIYRDYLFTDERGYHVWAKDLAAGIPHYWCHISPLPAYYMAAIYRWFGVDPICVRYANLVVGVATCWVLFAIGRCVGGTVVGLVSGLVAASYRPFVFLSITALKEPLVLFAFSLLVFFFLGELERHRLWQVLCVGIAVGLLSVLRPNAAVAVLIIGPVICWRARGRCRSLRRVGLAAAALVAGILIPSAPFMAKNYAVAGQFSPAPQGGVELYVGNDSERPYYTPAPFATPSPEEQGVHFRIEASRRTGRVLTFAQASSYWAREVASQASQAPARFARRMCRKAVAALHAREESDNHSIEFLRWFIPCLRWPQFSYALVMPLGMAGLITGVRRYRGALPLFLVVVAYELTLVLLYCNLRLRAPLLVVLIPFASAALTRLLSMGQSHAARRLVLLTTAALFAVIEHVPLAGTGDLTSHYNTHASLLMERGNQRGALAYWHKSQEMRGAFSDFATLSLAEFALAGGDAQRAKDMVSAIADASFTAALKYDLLGDALTQLHRAQEAAVAYEKSLSINSARRETRQKLIVLYAGLDEKRARAQEQVLADIQRFYARP